MMLIDNRTQDMNTIDARHIGLQALLPTTSSQIFTMLRRCSVKPGYATVAGGRVVSCGRDGLSRRQGVTMEDSEY
eukprot:gene5688-5368_t